MRIIAIHDGHNATACYLEDGKLVSMVSEERFTNKKNQGGYPVNSIQWILQSNDIDLKDIDHIAFPHHH